MGLSLNFYNDKINYADSSPPLLYFKVDRSIMRIFYINISDIHMYSLAIVMKYLLTENKLSEFMVG